jgi:hypothetical protein
MGWKGKELSTCPSVVHCESFRGRNSLSQQIIALPSSTLCGHSVCVLLPVRPALSESEVRVVSFAPFDEVVGVFCPCSGVWTTSSLPQFEGSVGGQAGHLSRGGGCEGH